MEVARKRIKLFHDFPQDRPHHLALAADSKFRPLPDAWRQPPALQYSTLLSGGDRGILLTRAHFDICEETGDTHAPNTNGVSAVPAVVDLKRTVNKKMSIQDYQRQKREGGLPAISNGNVKDERAKHPDISTEKERAFTTKGRSSPSSAKVVITAEEREKPLNERVAQAAHKTRTDAQHEHKKRTPDEPPSQGFRPHKKFKPDPSPPTSPPSKHPITQFKGDKVPNYKYRIPQDHDERMTPKKESTPMSRVGSRDSRTNADTKAEVKRLLNGDGTVKSTAETHNKHKTDITSKSIVPPLLSPLRFGPEAVSRSPKLKAFKEVLKGAKTESKATSDAESRAPRANGPLRLPPLLSPTLPEIVEAELAREAARLMKHDFAFDSDSAEQTKAKRFDASDDMRDQDSHNPPKRRLVRLKYKKANAKRVQSLLALPPASERHAIKMERSASVEQTPPVKKRPRPEEMKNSLSPQLASKRLKAVETFGRAPSTPSALATTPSQTMPGTSRSHAARPDHTATPTTSREADTTATGRNSGSKTLELRKRWTSYMALGTKIKHERDDLTASMKSKNGEKPSAQATQEFEHRNAILTMEMILAYIVSFKAQNQGRELDRRSWEVLPWEQLIPHLTYLQTIVIKWPPMHALTMQLQGICYGEMQRAHAHQYESPSAENGNGSLIRATKAYFQAWTSAQEARDKIKDDRMKTPSMGPWTAPVDAVAQALAIMTRWTRMERVEWKPSLTLPPTGS